MSNKRDNFKRISENRVSKILTLFDQLQNLTNSSFYEYTDEEIVKICDTLQDALDETRKTLLKKRSNQKTKRFEL